MRLQLRAACLTLLLMGACENARYAATVRPGFMKLRGDVALQDSSASQPTAAIRNDVGGSLGLDDWDSTIAVEVQTDLGAHRLRVGWLEFEKGGAGELAQALGDISAGVAVQTQAVFSRWSAMYTYDIWDSRCYRAAVGVDVAIQDLSIVVSSQFAREAVEGSAVVPMPCVECEIGIGPVLLGVVAAALPADLGDARGVWYNARVSARADLTDRFFCFLDYGVQGSDLEGRATDRAFEADLGFEEWRLSLGLNF